MLKVAIQGVAGSFHEVAADKLLNESHTIVPCDTFRDVFESVSKGDSDFGVVAVENSLQGSINAVYRLLEEHTVWICGEVSLKIEQCLISHTNTPITLLNSTNTTVLSHPVALVQAETWLNSNLPLAARREYSDTAASVAYIMEKQNPNFVAIASEGAAKLYGATVLVKPVNEDPHNYTRFFLLSKEKQPASSATRTSIILITSHKPGSLYRALGVFVDKNINLSKLDSHPIATNDRTYAFYIDYDLGYDEPNSQAALQELENQGCTVQVLGSYKASQIPA